MYGYIYLTTCLINDKIYIGQHCTKAFDPTYLGSGILQIKALKKYGKNNFNVIMLEQIATNQEDLNLKEQYYINKYNATDPQIGYNLDNGGTGKGKHSTQTKEKISKSTTGKKVSLETKQKMRESWNKKFNEQPELGLKIASHFGTGMLNKHQSLKQKQAVSKANSGKKMSEETKQKLKASRAKAGEAAKITCSKKIICIELNQIFNSIAEANRFFNRKSTASNITNIINTSSTAYGYHWQYLN